MKINSDNTMLDSSAEPVVTDGRSAAKENICIDELKINDDNKMIDVSTELIVNDDQSAAEENYLKINNYLKNVRFV